MKCPKCRSKNTRVTVTEHREEFDRSNPEGIEYTVRYNRCLECGYKFRTEEKVTDYLPRKPPEHSKLKREHILKIREKAAEDIKRGVSKTDMIVKLELEYNVSFSCIRDVIIGKTWKNVH